MSKVRSILRRFAKNESGAALVEYGVALLVVAAIGATAFTTLGSAVNDNVSAACLAIDTTC